MYSVVCRLVLSASILVSMPWMSANATQYLWQTNAEGDDIYIYQMDSFDLVHKLKVGMHPHGITVPDDNSVVFVSLERKHQPTGELLWINPETLTIERKIEVCKGPQNLAVTPNGRWIYLPCAEGYFAVIDTRTGLVVKKITTGGRPHNVMSSSDGRSMYLAPLGKVNGVTKVDVLAGHKVAGFIPFGGSVRPLAVSSDDMQLYQQVDGINGFKVADTSQLVVIDSVRHKKRWGMLRKIKKLTNLVARKLGVDPPYALPYCHGLAIRPDQKEIWATCGSHLSIHSTKNDHYAELELMDLEGKPYWVNFSPDSRYGVIAIKDRNKVLIVDTASRKIIKHLDTGESPKRNLIIEHTMTTHDFMKLP